MKNPKSGVYAKLGLLIASCILVSAVAYLLDAGSVKFIATHLNYWMVSIVFGACVFFAVRELKRAFPANAGYVGFFRRHVAGLVAVLAVSVFLNLHESHQAKILYDEDMLCGVAYQMHEERLATFPARAHYLDGGLTVMNSEVDKRPAMFPFVLSLIHDLTGYKPENVFFLNAALGFALLAMLYFWAFPIVGRNGAIAAILLMGTLPLLAQNVTGAGFEVMNLCMIAAFLLAARNYLNKPGCEGLDWFIVTSLMLAMVRYESILYIAALGVVVVIKWLRENLVTLTRFSAFSPLLLFSSFISLRIIFDNSLYSPTRDAGAAFFSWSYFPDNLGKAVYCLFSGPFSDQGNSLLLSAVGVVSILLIAVRLLSSVRNGKNWDCSAVALLPVAAAVFVTSFISLINSWGQWNDPMLSRYSLPLNLLFAVVFAYALSFVFGKKEIPVWVPVAVGLWLLLFSTPEMARHKMTNYTGVSSEARFFSDWAKPNTTSRDLFINESTAGLILEGHPCVSISNVNRAPWKLKAMLDSGFYERVFVCERFTLDVKGGCWKASSSFGALTSAIKLKKVAEYHPFVTAFVRISEVTGVDDPDAEKHRMPENPVERTKWVLESLP